GDAVLERSRELAREEVDKRHDDLDEDARETIASKVAVAAVRYFVLKYTREKEVHFSFEKALDWEGDSGPYLLYSTARAHGILAKAGEVETPEVGEPETDDTFELLRKIERFDTVLESAFEKQEPASIAHYLKELAESFNSFYHNCPVLDAETRELRETRLAAVGAFVQVMEAGLDILGIEPLEEM
ncbi:MAG: DALR anticodon-binding domain-containing protein, partial [Candidatus Nanohaloarchaea archaeon]|nr:DALR anticodon-binding domain-containing protein [Candidatus Nanohaloarchaea archaeon]